jgi:predicted Rossmann fold nucleotide-binding protein DprA/Smf involved in DNA uptake
MMSTRDYAHWIAVAHLPHWRTERINRLMAKIIIDNKLDLQEFFALSVEEWGTDFEITKAESDALLKAKAELPNYAFLAEDLFDQGFQIISINENDVYSPTLKKNLKMKYAPPLLYVKGNTKLLRDPSAAIVGSRNASQKAMDFADRIAEKCTRQYKAIVSGFAKGVDKQALDSSIKYNGHSIIVLPQGIMTFGSGIKKYYNQIIEGNVLVFSTFHPKAAWDVGLAMARNVYIYGLAEEIYVAESNSKGGTWSGVSDGLRKGRIIYVRQPDTDEKNANHLLIEKGAVAVDIEGNPIGNKVHDEMQTTAVLTAEPLTPYSSSIESGGFEEMVIAYLNKDDGPKTSKQIKDALQIDINTLALYMKLNKMPALKKIRNKQGNWTFIVSDKSEKQEKFGFFSYQRK